MGIQQTKELEDVEIDYKEDISDLVDAVILKDNNIRDFDLDARSMEYNELEIKKGKIEDITRPLKNVSTDIVVNEFFSTKETLYRFMNIVYNNFRQALTIYRKKRNIPKRKLFFLYKGGNVLRIVSSEFLLELPSSATRELGKFYSQFFKRSDADFSIYLDPSIKNYDIIYHELSLLSYLLQDRIRIIFLSDPTRYFDFYRYNKEYQRQLLESYLSEYNKQEGFENEFYNLAVGKVSVYDDNIYGLSNPDATLEFVDENHTLEVRKIANAMIKNSRSIMVITHNNSLDFTLNKIRTKFNLTRTKIVFTLFRRDNTSLNVGGELIDVSIPHKDNFGHSHFFEDLNKNVTTYKLSYKDCELSFKSSSLSYLSKDLEGILFIQREFPWLDNKYGKRINRLFYLYFIDIFIRLEDSMEKTRILKDIKSAVFIPSSKIKSIREFDKIREGIKEFISSYGNKNLNINAFLDGITRLFKKMKKKDLEEFREMNKLLIKNVDFVVKTIENIRQYCSINGRVKIRDIYDTNIDSLV